MLEGDFEVDGRLAIPRYRRLRDDPEAFELIQVICEASDASVRQIMGRTRAKHASRARHLAIYLCVVLLDRSIDTVAELFNRERGTVEHACETMEDRRDEDKVLEALIEKIERDFGAKCGAFSDAS